jgi:hypothetical protein
MVITCCCDGVRADVRGTFLLVVFGDALRSLRLVLRFCRAALLHFVVDARVPPRCGVDYAVFVDLFPGC